MSTSILCHGFGIRGYDYVRTNYKAGQVIFSIKHEPCSLRCPICEGKDIVRRGTATRLFRAVPIGSKAVFIKLPFNAYSV